MPPKAPALVIALTLGGAAVAASWWLSRRHTLPSSLSHLKLGRLWEYDIRPGGGTEQTEVVESLRLPDGRQAFRVEYRREQTCIDAVFTNDQSGQLIQLSQSKGAATFDPPLVGLGPLRVGRGWSTTSMMILPSKFRASSPTMVSGVVVGFESVTVPAGIFSAYRIDQVVNGRRSTSWHSPGVGMVRELAAEEELVLRRLSDTR